MSQQMKENYWIKDETSGVTFVEREIKIPKNIFEKSIMETLSKKIENLERQVQILKGKNELYVDSFKAKGILVKTIEKFKLGGIKEIDIIDLYNETHLPISQINEVMDELEKEGKVTEYGKNN